MESQSRVPETSADADAVVESMVEQYAARIAETSAAREALRLIFTRAIDDVAPDRLPPEIAEACAVLDRESGLGPAAQARAGRGPRVIRP